MEYIKIRVANKQGYNLCIQGGVCDLSYPTSKNRRARAQEEGRVAPAICANGEYFIIRRVKKNGK